MRRLVEQAVPPVRLAARLNGSKRSTNEKGALRCTLFRWSLGMPQGIYSVIASPLGDAYNEDN